MLRVPIEKVEAGMILARPISEPRRPGNVLVRRDKEIPADLLPKLHHWGVREVWIRNRPFEFLEAVMGDGLSEHQRSLYSQVRANFERIMNGATIEIDVSQFQSSIGDLFQFLKQNDTSQTFLQKLDAYDNYLLSHSTNVGYLALLMGIKLEPYINQERADAVSKDATDIQLMGLGCLLHDVGKMLIPSEILNKPARLTEEEMRIMQMHTVYGYEMVVDRIADDAADIALNHHQRWNGEGYPGLVDAKFGDRALPLAGRKIPVFSRIATIVDVYDAATSHRCYSRAKLPVQTLYELRNHCQGFFDPVVEQAFYEIIPPFPIGQVVSLSNGMEAVVVDFNPQFPYQPKVQGLRDPLGSLFTDPAQEEIDLSQQDDIVISRINGEDVLKYQSVELQAVESDLHIALA